MKSKFLFKKMQLWDQSEVDLGLTGQCVDKNEKKQNSWAWLLTYLGRKREGERVKG